jgi:hypothetical protein
MKKLIWIILAAFTLSAFSSSAAFVPAHGGERSRQLSKSDRAVKHHGKKPLSNKIEKKSKGLKKTKKHKKKG